MKIQVDQAQALLFNRVQQVRMTPMRREENKQPQSLSLPQPRPGDYRAQGAVEVDERGQKSKSEAPAVSDKLAASLLHLR